MNMKISRDFILGLGSGLVLSSLLMFGLQLGGVGSAPGSENRQTGRQTVSVQQQDNTQEKGGGSNTSAVSTPESDSTNTADKSNGPDMSSTLAQDSSSSTGESEKMTQTNSDQTQQEIRLTIPAGSDAEKIADLLLKKGLISNKEVFLETVKQRNVASQFKAGTYTIPSGLSINNLISILIQKPN
jgi:hypothetical protein